MFRTPIDKTTRYILVFIYLSMIGIVVLNILYSTHVARESVRQWCDIVVTLDNAYTAQPPQTPAGKQLASQMHELRGKLGC